MESTREERLQMRQRGAGTRKIQQVDFGFSFGDQQGGLADPAPPSLFPEPAKPPQEPPAPIATTPKASQASSQTTSQSQRTPRSARNNVPQRASAYDIPSDDGPQEPRSSKRRRINPINEDSGSPSIRKERETGHDGVNSASNGDALSSKEPETGDTVLPDAPPQEPTIEAPEPPAAPEVSGDIEMQEASNGEPDDHNTRAEATLQEQPSTSQTEGQGDTRKENPVETPQEPQPSIEPTKPAPPKKQRKSRTPPQAEHPPSKEGENSQPDISAGQESENAPAVTKEIHASPEPPKEAKKAQKRRGRPVNGDSSPAQAAEEPRTENETRSRSSDTQASASRNKRSNGRPLPSGKRTDGEAQTRSEPEPEQPEIPQPEADQEASNPRRGRRAKKDNKPTEPESNTRTEQPEAEVDTQLEKVPGPSKASRGRPARKDKPAEPESNTTPKEPEAVEVQPEKDAGPPKASRGRPAKKDKKSAEPESNTRAEQPEEEPAPSKPGRGRSGRNGKQSEKNAEQSETQPVSQPEPAPELSRSHRAKDGKRKKRTREAEPEAAPQEEQPATENAPQSEREQPGEEEQEPEDSHPPQQRSTKRGRKSKTVHSESTPTEERAESQPARERRKQREPRGETVPVTVHRLANSSALGMMYASAGSEDENEDSADELSTQKTKLPKRGGVNPADVLGQICRETLEKTLTALKNGIENESNTQRRAEWTRKRKAVEAFGSELDGRLLDLSEMLDSNFVLGVQLKKEKRDMMDLRTHLYKVRREREALALQMDAVRAKHMEEEAAKTSRTTINNSLHSLELALDRTQHRDPPSADPPSAELEFMLRTVADDVSCRAPGSQGGLLEQIRTFNAQLESTARRLEGQ